jgi:hypothetical protein
MSTLVGWRASDAARGDRVALDGNRQAAERCEMEEGDLKRDSKNEKKGYTLLLHSVLIWTTLSPVLPTICGLQRDHRA